jgi:hypothetical protein
MLACDLDTATDNFGTLATPTGLTSFTVLDRLFTTNGDGGGIIVASGIKATAGFVGNLTWTFATAAAWSGIAMSLPPTLPVTEFEGWGGSL